MIVNVSRLRTQAVLAVTVIAVPAAAAAQSVRERYETLVARQERVLTLIAETPTDAPQTVKDDVANQARSVVAGFDGLVRRYFRTGYADNALWNAAEISEAVFARFQRASDRDAAERYYGRLVAEYPTSSLVNQARTKQRNQVADAAATTNAGPVPVVAAPPPATPTSAPTAPSAPSPISSTPALLTSIERTVLREGVRITINLDREVAYHEERVPRPERVFFDLKGVRAASELRDAVLRFEQDAVRQIRVGRHPENVVRVVLDLEGVKKYSVFTLYHPFRLVIDCEPLAPTSAALKATTTPAPTNPGVRSSSEPATAKATAPLVPSEAVAPVDRVEPAPIAKPAPPAPPSSNTAGGFSLSRQLGLGIARVVIDPGHGGHDPGAQGKGLDEAELTLDVALRVEKLLQADGFDVILTRRSNVYIPLEERTAIANREGADLFLSIHANASRSASARGVETYFLSFASTPDAEAVAARENSSSAAEMHSLPDIVKAITLNNKLDESRDFATMVQEAMVSRLRRSNKDLRSLGVKKAPFVVLIGAAMPSVLAEISFLTNKQELTLLKTNTYKQRVAEALHAAVVRYRRSLKGALQVAEQ